jgi:DNA-binding CsgD family transcriptional regulator
MRTAMKSAMANAGSSSVAGKGQCIMADLPKARVAGSDFLAESEWQTLRARLGLTNRELEITRLVMEGLTELAIGHRLHISTHTVHTHLRRLYQKLSAHGKGDLIMALFRAYVELHRS